MEPDRNSYDKSLKKGGSPRIAAPREPSRSISDRSSSQPIHGIVPSSSTGVDEPVDLPRLERALVTVSMLVIENYRYQPIFDRLMAERDKLLNRQDTVSRAQAFLDENPALSEMVGNR